VTSKRGEEKRDWDWNTSTPDDDVDDVVDDVVDENDDVNIVPLEMDVMATEVEMEMETDRQVHNNSIPPFTVPYLEDVNEHEHEDKTGMHCCTISMNTRTSMKEKEIESSFILQGE